MQRTIVQRYKNIKLYYERYPYLIAKGVKSKLSSHTAKKKPHFFFFFFLNMAEAR